MDICNSQNNDVISSEKIPSIAANQAASNNICQKNNDIRDKEERRRSKARLSISRTRQISNIEINKLKDLYAECIKLSSENKISSNNAFGLELIDYMEQVLDKVDQGLLNSFQIASCTLEASMKIYCHRVDSVLVDAFKMAGNLSENPPEKQIQQQSEDVVEKLLTSVAQVTEEPKIKKIRPKTNKSSNKVERNLKKLEWKKFKNEEEADLWNGVYAKQPVSREFGAGGPFSYTCSEFKTACDFGIVPIDLRDKIYVNISIKNNGSIEIPHEAADSIVEEISRDSEPNTNRFLDKLDFEEWIPPVVKKLNKKNLVSVLLGEEIVECDTASGLSIGDPNMDIENSIDGPLDVIPEAPLDNSFGSLNNSLEPDLPEMAFDSEPQHPQTSSKTSPKDSRVLTVMPDEYTYFSRPGVPFVPSTASPTSRDKINFLSRSRRHMSLLSIHSFTKSRKSHNSLDYDYELTESDIKQLDTSKRIVKMDQDFDQLNENNTPKIEIVPLPAKLDKKKLFRLFTVKYTVGHEEGKNSEKLIDECRLDGDSLFDGESFHGQLAFDDQEEELNESFMNQPLYAELQKLEYAKSAKIIDSKSIKTSMVKVIENIATTEQRQDYPFDEFHVKVSETVSPEIAEGISLQLSFLCLLHVVNENNLAITNNPEETYQLKIHFCSNTT